MADSTRPTLQQSKSRTSVKTTASMNKAPTSPRQRTISLPANTKPPAQPALSRSTSRNSVQDQTRINRPRSIIVPSSKSIGQRKMPFSPIASKAALAPPRLVANGIKGASPPLVSPPEMPNPTDTSPKPKQAIPPMKAQSPPPPEVQVPFYISSFHRPSTHPRWMDLTPTDFADWLPVAQAAGHKVVLEIWYECPQGWKVLPPASTTIDLRDLRKVDKDIQLEENALQFTLANQGTKGVWYLPPPRSGDGLREIEEEKASKNVKRRSAGGIVEKSIRETRMKQGIGVNGLHR